MNELKNRVKQRLKPAVERLLYQHLVSWGTTLCLSVACLLLIANLAGYYGTEGVLMAIMASVPFGLMFLYSFAILRGTIYSIWKFSQSSNISISDLLQGEGIEYDHKIFQLNSKEKAMLNNLKLSGIQLEYLKKLNGSVTYDSIIFMDNIKGKS